MKLLEYFRLKKAVNKLKERHDYYVSYLRPRDKLCEINDTLRIQVAELSANSNTGTKERNKFMEEIKELKDTNKKLKDSVLAVLGPSNLPEYKETTEEQE